MTTCLWNKLTTVSVQDLGEEIFNTLVLPYRECSTISKLWILHLNNFLAP